MRDWLKKIRTSANLTQEQVAESAEISRTYYARIENGEYEIPVSTAKVIAQVLQFDWTRFYGEEPQSENTA